MRYEPAPGRSGNSAQPAFVLGLISLVLAITCFCSFFSVITGPLAIILGRSALRSTVPGEPGRNRALTGIYGGAVGTVVGILLVFVMIVSVIIDPPKENRAAEKLTRTAPTRTSARPMPTASASSAAPVSTVPFLVGSDYDEKDTEAALRRLGLRVRRAVIGGDYFPMDGYYKVLSTQPKPGSVVKPGSMIVLTLGTGEQSDLYRKYRRMPRLVGQSSDKVESLLYAISDLVSQKKIEDDSLPEYEGKVTSQSPPPGAPLAPGQKIRLTVHGNFDVDLPSGGGSGGGGGGGHFNCPRTRWC